MAHPLQAFFGKIKLFSSLSGDELNDLLRAIRPVQYSAGERLFTEGDPGDAAYVIESGELASQSFILASQRLHRFLLILA